MIDHLQIRLECEAIPEGTLEIARLDGTEAISRLFHFDLLVVSKDAAGLDGEELIGRSAALVFERDGEEVRRIFGMISLFNDRLDTETEHSSYRLAFAPRAFRLTLVETLDVFLDLSVPDILRQKLRD